AYNRDYSATDGQRPSMSVYEALLVDRYDPETTRRLVAAMMKEGLGLSADSAVATVRMRARSILQLAASYASTTLRTFEGFVRNTSQLPGLKVAFFISDGFLLDTNNSDIIVRLQRITDAAARSGVVIYSLHARGLETGLGDVTESQQAGTFSARLGEIQAQQDPLNALAVDTGGRLVKNTNDFTAGIRKALEETSSYYLFAWRPEAETQREGRFRSVKVSVRGRPELTVRLQKGFFDGRPKSTPKPTDSAAAKAPEEQLRAAVGSLYPKRALPVALAVSYVDTGSGGPTVGASIQIESDAVEFTPDEAGGKATGLLDVVGAVFNADGRQEDGFKTRLTVTASGDALAAARRPDILYHFSPRLRPGLYQVRVAARDSKSGLVGSSLQWVEVPDLAARRLALSSLLVGERTADAKTMPAARQPDASPFAEAPLSVDRRFARTSALRYLVYVYNSSGPTPDVTLQTRVLRGNQVVFSTEPRKVSPEGQEPGRLAYAADVPLAPLAPGRYVLHVGVNDRAAGKTAERRVVFEVR
ncbi:MAG TPA: VWA domain-containing protein, partial [Pyrinomonadaceae bacterium]|nr:VWA domain-containing protein [Pyrinomonadaceae bacterium]